MTASEQLAEREYDLSSRHVLVGRVIDALVAPGAAILDIGGSEGLSQLVLPGHRVVTVDILSTGVDAVASGGALPFRDRGFAAVVALDVLEHVPNTVKEQLIDEAARVADVVVLAGPYDDPLVRDAERHQRDLFIALFGKDHSWLKEHADAGLPSLEVTIAQLRRHGFATAHFGSNPLPLWSTQLLNSHTALRSGFDEQTLPLRRQLLREFLDRADRTPPSYRHIVVGSRADASDIEAVIAGLAPGTDQGALSDAVRATELTTCRVIDHAQNVLTGIRDEAIAGWTESVDTIHLLENRISAAPTEQTVEALERMVLEAGLWRRALDGPPVTVDARLDPDVAAYQAWWAARPSPAPPPAQGPVFSIVTPVYNPDPAFLTASIRSVRRQTYPHWQLVLVDASTAPHVAPICRRFALVDERITVVTLANEGIAANTNAGASAATGEWLTFLDHDDLLAPHALAGLAQRVSEVPDADLVYSDEDKLDASGGHFDPLFKPDWSPDLLRTVNYIGHLVAVRASLFHRIGGQRPGFEGAQDFDFLLRATDEARRVEHVADVLYHWRHHPLSTAADVRVKPEAHSAGRRALQDFARRRLPGAWLEPGAGTTAHRMRYPLRVEPLSIIVPFRDGADLTTACLAAIARCGSALPIEVVLVSNQSREARTTKAMAEWEHQFEWIRVVEFDEPFNFQRLNNWAATQAKGSLLLFLNNDTEPLHGGWIEALAEMAQREDVGAVGARLFYPNGLVQHAGVAVGIGGLADHPWAGLHPDAWTAAGPSNWVRDVTAVTAACLMVQRDKFERVGGFDERFLVCGGDVDLCLRLHATGLTNVMTPFARLVHHESATRKRQPPDNDVRESLRAYAEILGAGDPYYNSNLTLNDTSCRVADL